MYISVRALVRLVGKMNASSPINPPAPLLFCQQMAMVDTLNMNFQFYEAQVTYIQEKKFGGTSISHSTIVLCI